MTSEEPYCLCSPDNWVYPGHIRKHGLRASKTQEPMAHTSHLHTGEGQRGLGVAQYTKVPDLGCTLLGRAVKAILGLILYVGYFSPVELISCLSNTEVTDSECIGLIRPSDVYYFIF